MKRKWSLCIDPAFSTRRNDCGKEIKGEMNREEKDTRRATGTELTMVASCVNEVNAGTPTDDEKVATSAQGNKFTKKSCIVNELVKSASSLGTILPLCINGDSMLFSS